MKVPTFIFLFSFLAVNSFATFTSRKLSVRVSCVFSKATWLKRFCDIFALSQDFIRLPVENERSPEALVAGLTWIRQIYFTSLIILVWAESTFLIAFKQSEKHCSFSPSIMKISSCGIRYSIPSFSVIELHGSAAKQNKAVKQNHKQNKCSFSKLFVFKFL